MKQYIITAVQYGSESIKKYERLIDTYAKHINAQVLVLPIRANYIKDDYLPELPESFKLITSKYKFNSYLSTVSPNNQAGTINPLAGLIEFAPKYGSCIVGAPRLDFQIASDDNKGNPTGVWCTGCISEPNYKIHTKQGKLATKKHKFGFLVVSVVGEIFHIRSVEIKHNEACDLNNRITQSKVYTIPSVSGMVLGDLHFPNHDKQAVKACKEQMQFLKPKKVVLHDIADSISVNPHESNSIIGRILSYKEGMVSLEVELKHVYDNLIAFTSDNPKTTFYIVESNHDDFIERYIDSGRFIHDPNNCLFAAELLVEYIKHGDPILKHALSRIGKIPKNIVFLTANSKLTIDGFYCAKHFIKSNGAVAGKSLIHKNMGMVIQGHEHTPCRYNDVLVAGCNCRNDMRYTRASLSSWLFSNVVVHANGTAQHVNTICGKWK